MSVAHTNYFTWNPVLHFQLLRGGPKDFEEDLRRRTVRFRYQDRALAYDAIEWELDNHDGMMLRPEYLALGVVVRVRLGYTGCEAPWRTFLIDRVRGDPGVYSLGGAATGQPVNVHGGRAHTDARVIYSGRNRNAKAPKKGSRTTKKGTKYFPSSQEIVSHDYTVYASGGPRIFPGRTTAECVRNIAAALGFHDHMQMVEDTQDTLFGLAVPNNVPDGVFLRRLARDKGFIFRIDEAGFHFHSPSWTGGAGKTKQIAREYVLGGPDIIRISIDGDYRLPMPSTVKTTGRHVTVRHTSSALAGAGATKGFLTILNFLPAEQQANLQRDYVIPISDAGRMASDKAARNFINARLNSYKIKVDIVGDPVVRATNNVQLFGSGTPLVDGVWYVEEADHTFTGTAGQTYVTTLTLKQPPKAAKVGRAITVVHSSSSLMGAGATKGMLTIQNYYDPAEQLKSTQSRAAPSGPHKWRSGGG